MGTRREKWQTRRKAQRRELEMIAPGSGLRVQLDRGAWGALGQREAGTWSWTKALAALLGGLVIGGVIFYVVGGRFAGYVGLALAYLLGLYRARQLHLRYLEREAAASRVPPEP